MKKGFALQSFFRGWGGWGGEGTRASHLPSEGSAPELHLQLRIFILIRKILMNQTYVSKNTLLSKTTLHCPGQDKGAQK
jgi:hypothetical protein